MLISTINANAFSKRTFSIVCSSNKTAAAATVSTVVEHCNWTNSCLFELPIFSC